MTDVLDTLTGPGGPFEVVTEEVQGVPVQVYKNRLHSMRDLIDMSDGRADTDFVVQGDRRLSYAGHNARARTTAAGLAARGVERGDRVALLSANSPEWVVAFWACAAAGAICVPLNAWWRAEELEFALEDSGTRVLICDERRWELVKHLPDALPALEQVYVIGTGTPAVEAAAFGDLEADGDPGGFPAVDVDEDDIAGIFYTSGTTGKPKGATITHRQTLANLQNLFLLGTVQLMQGAAPPAELSGTTQAASLLIVPLFHTTGCHSTMVLTYASGGKLVLMPPGRFDPDAAMRLMQDERVTSIGGVPTVMWRLLESPNFGAYDLSSVTRISYGGAPSGAELVERISEAFPNAKSGLATAYGLTETASVATAIGGDDYVAHPGSAGRAVPTVELRIVGADGNDVPRGETGEVWIKGPTVSSHGYWNRPDANAESFTDGWFHTGDLGRFDAEGYLYIVDRAKDMLIRGGENIYCVEIEEVLYEHPDVIDAAVVGVPHRTLGEEVKAVVQLKSGSTTSAADLQRFCAEHLAAYKVPAHVDLVLRPLPRNPAGKILKQALRGTTTSFAAEEASDSAL